MFFVLSKTAGLLIDPYYFALFLLLCAGVLRLLRRAKRLQRGLVIAAGIYLLLFATGPVANLLLYPLETRHVRPARLERPPGAIIMLGGVLDRQELGAGYYEMQDSADRFVEAVRLALRYPGAPLLITGGSSAILQTAQREADVLHRLALDLGVPPKQVRVDRRARNTYENALHAKELLADVKGPLLVVTSAVHMPRSAACFRKLGLEVIPWPVDFQRTSSGPGSWLPKPSTLQRSNDALHEYLGWLAYLVAGYV